MDWDRSYVALGHTMFIQFIELKIEGTWRPYVTLVQLGEEKERVLEAKNIDTCIVKIVEPDGLRRIFQFNHSILHEIILFSNISIQFGDKKAVTCKIYCL